MHRISMTACISNIGIRLLDALLSFGEQNITFGAHAAEIFID